MAAVTFTNGTKKNLNGPTSDIDTFLWVSPSTMDSADTVVLPTLTGRTPIIIGGCFDGTTGDLVTATLSTQTVTIDAAGGTTDHSYYLVYGYY